MGNWVSNTTEIDTTHNDYMILLLDKFADIILKSTINSPDEPNNSRPSMILPITVSRNVSIVFQMYR